jgi:tripartite-type tricarboxylate transporter receptor subunit TctC
LPHLKTGKLTPLGVTSAKRSPVAADVPTIGESLAGYEVENWYGLFVPARTPKEIVVRLNRETAKVLQMPDVLEKLRAQGLEPLTSTPEQFAAYVKSETVKWARLVKESGARVD